MRPGPGLAAAPSLSPYASPSLSGAALGQGGPSAQGRPRSEPPHKHIKVKPASSVTEVFVFRCLPARSPREGRWPGAPLGDIFIPLVVSKHSGKKIIFSFLFHFFPSRGCPQGPGSARRNGIGAEREGGAVCWGGGPFGRCTARPLPGSAPLWAVSPWQRGLLPRPSAASPPGSAMRAWARTLRAAGPFRWAAARPGAVRAAHRGQSERPQGRRAELPSGPDLRHFLRGVAAPPPAGEPEPEPGSTSGLGKGRCATVPPRRTAQPSLAQPSHECCWSSRCQQAKQNEAVGVWSQSGSRSMRSPARRPPPPYCVCLGSLPAALVAGRAVPSSRLQCPEERGLSLPAVPCGSTLIASLQAVVQACSIAVICFEALRFPSATKSLSVCLACSFSPSGNVLFMQLS